MSRSLRQPKRKHAPVADDLVEIAEDDTPMQVALLESLERTTTLRSSPASQLSISNDAVATGTTSANGAKRNLARRSPIGSSPSSSLAFTPQGSPSAAADAAGPWVLSPAPVEEWQLRKPEEDYTEEDVQRIAESLDPQPLQQQQQQEAAEIEKLASVDDSKYEKLNTLLDKTTLFAEFLEKDRIKKVANKAATAAAAASKTRGAVSRAKSATAIEPKEDLSDTVCVDLGLGHICCYVDDCILFVMYNNSSNEDV